MQAFRWIADSRDNATEKRKEKMENSLSLWRCHTILNCTKTCPKNLNPARAIQQIKYEMTFGSPKKMSDRPPVGQQ